MNKASTAPQDPFRARRIDKSYSGFAYPIPGVRVGSIIFNLQFIGSNMQPSKDQRYLVMSIDGDWLRVVAQPLNELGRLDDGLTQEWHEWVNIRGLVAYSVYMK